MKTEKLDNSVANKLKPTLSKPSFWYLGVSLLLGLTAYPGVTWLPGFVERFRYGGVGLLPFPLLATRQLGGMIALLALILFVLFLVSAFYPRLHNPIHYKAWGVALVFIYTIYSLLLMACFAIAG